MRKILSKKILASFCTLGIAGMLVLPAVVGAAADDPTTAENLYGIGTASGLTTGVKLGTKDIKSTIAQIINVVLGFLGVIAVVIVLAGGFKWMTAGGSDDKVGEARKMIVQGVIGLVIVFSAWAIASFVIGQLKSATIT